MANVNDQDRASDLLIQEVDEDLRREQYLKLWRRYGGLVIAGAVVLVVAVGGWQAWQGWQERQRQAEATRYAAAQSLAEAGKTTEAKDALAAIAAGGKAYAVPAAMQRAEILIKENDIKGAIATYEQIAASSAPELLRGLATMKEALLALDQPGDNAALEQRLTVLAAPASPWHYQATELTALFAQKKGDTKRALELFKQLADDTGAPTGMRSRASDILAALGPAPTLTPTVVAPPAPAGATPAAPATPPANAAPADTKKP